MCACATRNDEHGMTMIDMYAIIFCYCNRLLTYCLRKVNVLGNM